MHLVTPTSSSPSVFFFLVPLEFFCGDMRHGLHPFTTPVTPQLCHGDNDFLFFAILGSLLKNSKDFELMRENLLTRTTFIHNAILLWPLFHCLRKKDLHFSTSLHCNMGLLILFFATLRT